MVLVTTVNKGSTHTLLYPLETAAIRYICSNIYTEVSILNDGYRLKDGISMLTVNASKFSGKRNLIKPIASRIDGNSRMLRRKRTSRGGS